MSANRSFTNWVPHFYSVRHQCINRDAAGISCLLVAAFNTCASFAKFVGQAHCVETLWHIPRTRLEVLGARLQYVNDAEPDDDVLRRGNVRVVQRDRRHIHAQVHVRLSEALRQLVCALRITQGPVSGQDISKVLVGIRILLRSKQGTGLRKPQRMHDTGSDVTYQRLIKFGYRQVRGSACCVTQQPGAAKMVVRQDLAPRDCCQKLDRLRSTGLLMRATQ